MAPDLTLAQRTASIDGNLAPEQDVALFPLTMPFTAGPGSIAVAIALGAEKLPGNNEQMGAFGGTSLAALVIAALVWTIYASADRLSILLGSSGERVLGRLVAFLLLCIGVQMLWTGFVGLLTPWFEGNSRILLPMG